jgi:UDP-N-acetylmuramoyl-L-alanyl-D-glutamate--2,6-diaminopimelate ligase
MPKTLAQLLVGPGVRPVCVRGGEAVVTSVVSDSRRVVPGACFVAIPGYATDGHRYIPQALEAGAVAIVYDNPAYDNHVPPSLPAARVPDARRACAVMSVALWDSPSSALTLTGVTSTNGKTTTVTLVDALCRHHGLASAALGTLGRAVNGVTEPRAHTTLDSVELQAELAALRDEGITHVAMECSSHALSLDRTWGLKFDVVAFGNLSQDHLDFYGSMSEYMQAKVKLFTEYAALAQPEKQMRAVISTDDPAGRDLVEQAECPVLTFGLGGADAPTPELTAREVACSAQGARFRLCHGGEAVPVELQLLGGFNVMNALCAAGCGLALGFSLSGIAEALGSVPPVAGRFERVDEGQDFGVAVDYAHTPDGLRNILTSARELTSGRLICVFGCGGDRDRAKRPIMGAIAAELADLAVVTADNPRSESVEAILADILTGTEGGRAETRVEPDRRRAIDLAVSLCETGDMLVIAGKGHEPYQVFADKTIHFDDREEARRALRERLGGGRS